MRFVDHISAPGRSERAPPMRSGWPLVDVLTPKAGDTRLVSTFPSLGRFQNFHVVYDRLLPVADDFMIARVSVDGGKTLDATANSWSYLVWNYNGAPASGVGEGSLTYSQMSGTMASGAVGRGMSGSTMVMLGDPTSAQWQTRMFHIPTVDVNNAGNLESYRNYTFNNIVGVNAIGWLFGGGQAFAVQGSIRIYGIPRDL